MGFVNLQTSFAPIFLLKWLSKAYPDGGIFFTNPAKRLCLRSPLLGEGLGVRLYFPSLCDVTPFTLRGKVNGVTTRFDVDYMVKWVKLQRNLRQITIQTDLGCTNWG